MIRHMVDPKAYCKCMGVCLCNHTVTVTNTTGPVSAIRDQFIHIDRLDQLQKKLYLTPGLMAEVEFLLKQKYSKG